MELLNKLAANCTSRLSGTHFLPSSTEAENQFAIRSAYWLIGYCNDKTTLKV
jgi:hypothetical protein